MWPPSPCTRGTDSTRRAPLRPCPLSLVPSVPPETGSPPQADADGRLPGRRLNSVSGGRAGGRPLATVKLQGACARPAPRRRLAASGGGRGHRAAARAATSLFPSRGSRADKRRSEAWELVRGVAVVKPSRLIGSLASASCMRSW